MRHTKKFGITGSTLKIIAIITMFIDHIGAALLEQGLFPHIVSELTSANSSYTVDDYSFWITVDNVMRCVGRLAFPIFCFLLVEGFLHTSSILKYALRLGVFALLSEIPFNLAFSGQIFNYEMQNVFLTLLIGLLVMAAMKYLEETVLIAVLSNIPLILCDALVIGIGMALASFLKTDYSYFGVLIIALLYIFRKNRKRQCLVGAIGFLWELSAPLSFLPIYFYNGERGNLRLKYFFYVFYPAHLLLLVLVRMFLF